MNRYRINKNKSENTRCILENRIETRNFKPQCLVIRNDRWEILLTNKKQRQKLDGEIL